MNGIEVVDAEPLVVIGLRRHGPYSQIGEMFRELYEFAIARNIVLTGPPIFICHEMTPEEAVAADRTGSADIEVALPTAEETEISDDIRCYTLDGGRMARLVHKGPYDAVGPAYERLFEWLELSGLRLCGPTREVFLNDPREVPAEELLTEILAPIGQCQ